MGGCTGHKPHTAVADKAPHLELKHTLQCECQSCYHLVERVQYTARSAGQIVVCGNVTSVNLASTCLDWCCTHVADVSIHCAWHSLKDVHAYHI